MPVRVSCQEATRPARGGPPRQFAVVLVNAAIGAVTATVRARIGGHNATRAFAKGALGGIVHVAGKAIVTSSSSSLAQIPGFVIGGIGTSAVTNAGNGEPLLSNIVLPIGPLRVRMTSDGPRVRVGVNACEVGALTYLLFKNDVSVNWQRTLSSGTAVFGTNGGRLRVTGVSRVQALTLGGSIVLSDVAYDPSASMRHELIHVLQQRYVEETIGRTIENAILTWSAIRVPAWLEVGVTAPALFYLDHVSSKPRWGPIRRLQEAEAEWFER